MNRVNTTTVSLAVTPTVLETFVSHYLNRNERKGRPTAHLSYDEGLHLIRTFLLFASHHTVEELQAFTAQWVPHPQYVKVEDATISDNHLGKAAALLEAQLGEDGIRRVGGSKWWQWRKPKSPLMAEWIEMRTDAHERKRRGGVATRVMMYVHGGGYFFGSVDEHRYQMQRHARKLGARVFAPRYRLAPQFPFPCGLQDCIAAYLHLLTTQDPTQIVFAGDSAGGGMIMSMLCILRDQGIPLPAGGILISPWVDLTHSFPSVCEPAPMDYVPEYGFQQRPSRGWPPPNEDDVVMLKKEAEKEREKKGSQNTTASTAEIKEKQQGHVAPVNENSPHGPEDEQATSGGMVSDPEKLLTVTIDGETVRVKDQIQMYATNDLLDHPLVSSVMQPTLGGLPPLLIMTGGGEILRDEQIYLAHKCADPARYAPPSEKMDDKGRELLAKYKPTYVQLQVWDDLCHVAPTLSFTRPAKYMYRSIAQFGAWCLARAQKRSIEIMDDDVSDISLSGSDAEQEPTDQDREILEEKRRKEEEENMRPKGVGKAGDPLPKFREHMIRQRVDRHGVTHPLAKAEELPACTMKPEEIGNIKPVQVKKWLTAKRKWDSRYASTKAKVYRKIIEDMVVGYETIPGENPPPSALAGRWRVGDESKTQKRTKQVKSVGLALWSLWGSKHDEEIVERQRKAAAEEEKGKEKEAGNPDIGGEQGATRSLANMESKASLKADTVRSRSRQRSVLDENQTGEGAVDENTPIAELLKRRRAAEKSSTYLEVPETGAMGKRPFVDGIAMPFSINKEAETASMLTLNSGVSPAPASGPIPPGDSKSEVLSIMSNVDIPPQAIETKETTAV